MSYLIQYVHFSQDVWSMRFSEMKHCFSGLHPNFLKEKKRRKKF